MKAYLIHEKNEVIFYYAKGKEILYNNVHT